MSTGQASALPSEHSLHSPFLCPSAQELLSLLSSMRLPQPPLITTQQQQQQQQQLPPAPPRLLPQTVALALLRLAAWSTDPGASVQVDPERALPVIRLLHWQVGGPPGRDWEVTRKGRPPPPPSHTHTPPSMGTGELHCQGWLHCWGGAGGSVTGCHRQLSISWLLESEHSSK